VEIAGEQSEGITAEEDPKKTKRDIGEFLMLKMAVRRG
jgi:hypothetical protein